MNQLNQDTDGVLARAKADEEAEITERGTATGLGGREPMLRPRGLVRTDLEAGELIRSLREDERY